MTYEIGQIYEFDVIKDYGEDEDIFRLHIPGYGEGRLAKFKFQKNEPLPDRLKCRIKFFSNGFPVPGHYMPQYVNRFYRQGYEQGAVFEFKVVGLPPAPGGHFSLEDKYGIRYNLHDNAALLVEGQKVLCRFTKLSVTYFNLELANGDMRLPLIKPEVFLGNIGVKGIMRSRLVKLLGEFLPDAQAELDSDSALWVVTALKGIGSRLAEWFVQSDIRRHNVFFRKLVAIARTGGLYLLENSRFLRNLAEEQRRNLQAILTEAVENLDPFRLVLELVESGKEREFVESLMTKLRESGYLYHPARQFSLMMMIFRTEPALVQTYLGKIFETIMEWKLETWTAEPFRSAFVRQFEIYIRQSCREIDLLPQADTQADIDRIEKIVTAIALQMLISGDSTSSQYKRNRSLFYRYISLLRPVRSDELLDKAFLTLMGVNLPLEFTYDTIKEPTMLMTRATVRPPEDASNIDTIHSMQEGDIQITVDGDGISVMRTDDTNAGRILPNGMMEWLSPQIYLSGLQSLNGGQLNSFDAHRRLWGHIEKALFESRAHAAAKIRERRKAEVGDRVKIHISQDERYRADNPMWEAAISDENFFDGKGVIYRDNIVGYNLRSSDLDRNRALARSAFVDSNGRPRHFLATVESIDHEGIYHFSLIDDVAEQCGNIMNYNDTYLAVIANCDQYEYSAIAETGYGIHLQRQPGDPEYHRQDIVAFRVLDMNNPRHIKGTILYDEEGQTLDKVFAFSELMKGISFDEEDDELDGTMMLDSDENLSHEDVIEIIELIRFKAISTSNLLAAYDYLQFGRLLALIIGAKELAKRLEVHAAMLRLHQFYATNRRVDSDELEKFRSEVAGFPMLEVVFHRLEIVSWLGDADHNEDLWETVKEGRNLLESNLARLVLSVNMLPDGSNDDAVAEGLKTKIAQMLGVNFEARQLKSYGRENQFIEFKSSIVYPARKKGEKVKADPEAQQFVILKTIAGFLNSSGGTLYIGVNDYTRCEAGLFEDFEYYKHRKATNHGYFYDVKNIDNYIVFLSNMIRNEWGTLMGESVQVSRDEEASHDVVVVKVSPRTTPVFLNDTIFVRRSNNTMMLNEAEQKEFVEERKMLELRRREELNVAMAKEEARKVELVEATATKTKAEVPTEVTAPEATYDVQEEDTEKVATSTWRPNVLHDWEEGYVEPAGYLYFKSDNTFKRTVEDRQADYDPDCVLAMSFTAGEEQQGLLVMVFDNQKILKVPMSEIMEKDADRDINFYKDGNLVFATIAMPGQALLAHLTDSKTTVHRRVVPLADIANGHLNSNPEIIADAPGVAGVVGCEIVAENAMELFSGSLEKDMSTRQIGYTLRTAADTDRARQLFDEDCRKSSGKS